MDWPANQGSSGGKKRLWRTALRNPKSMGFSVYKMAGDSEAMTAHSTKNSKKTASAAATKRHSFLKNETILGAWSLNTTAETAAPAASIPMMVNLVLGMRWVNPSIHRA